MPPLATAEVAKRKKSSLGCRHRISAFIQRWDKSASHSRLVDIISDTTSRFSSTRHSQKASPPKIHHISLRRTSLAVVEHLQHFTIPLHRYQKPPLSTRAAVAGPRGAGGGGRLAAGGRPRQPHLTGPAAAATSGRRGRLPATRPS